MADGVLIITIDEALAGRLKLAADEAGETVESYARRVLDAAADGVDWAEIDRICDAAVTHGGMPAEQALDRFAADVEARLARQG